MGKSANRMFSFSSFRRSCDWIFIILGCVGYILGYFFIDENSVWKDISIKLADVLIIGVIIGFVTNAAKFMGIFKEELIEVIYRKESLEQRKDIYSIWEMVSKVLFKDKFPKIHKELLKTVNSYLPKDEISYYNDYEVNTLIEWVDKDKNIIKVTDNVSFELIADSTDKFDYPLKTWTTVKEHKDDYKHKTEISVKGGTCNKIEKGEYLEDGDVCHEYILELKGATQYNISYTREKIYNFGDDYILGLRAKYIIKDLRVCLELPEGIAAQFSFRGTTDDFEDVKCSKNQIKKRYKGIVLPRQGYIFALRKT